MLASPPNPPGPGAHPSVNGGTALSFSSRKKKQRKTRSISRRRGCAQTVDERSDLLSLRRHWHVLCGTDGLAAQAARGLDFQHECIKGNPGLSVKMVLCVLLLVIPWTLCSAAEGPSWNILPPGCRKCRPRQDGIAGDFASGASVHAA